MKNLMDFLKSKKMVAIIASVFGLALLAAAFSFGVFIGYHKAKFSYAWGENYNRNFGGPRRGMLNTFTGDGFIAGHGVSGQIIRIDGPTIVVKGQDNVEKIAVINDDTVIRRLRETIKLSDLKINDLVIIIGNPDDSGQIEARFLRILPLPVTSPSQSLQ